MFALAYVNRLLTLFPPALGQLCLYVRANAPSLAYTIAY